MSGVSTFIEALLDRMRVDSRSVTCKTQSESLHLAFSLIAFSLLFTAVFLYKYLNQPV
jgi:hypothetical protein